MGIYLQKTNSVFSHLIYCSQIPSYVNASTPDIFSMKLMVVKFWSKLVISKDFQSFNKSLPNFLRHLTVLFDEILVVINLHIVFMSRIETLNHLIHRIKRTDYIPICPRISKKFVQNPLCPLIQNWMIRKGHFALGNKLFDITIDDGIQRHAQIMRQCLRLSFERLVDLDAQHGCLVGGHVLLIMS